MKKTSKFFCVICISLICLIMFAARAKRQEWSEDNVVFSYDALGNVTITFPDNFDYEKSPTLTGGDIAYNYSPANQRENELSRFNSVHFGDDVSLCLVKITRKLSVSESKEKIAHYVENEPPYCYSTFYEAVLIYDFVSGEELNRTFYYLQDSRDDVQVEGVPPLQNGDTLVGMIDILQKNGQFLSFAAFEPFFAVGDTVSMDTYVYDCQKSCQEDFDFVEDVEEDEAVQKSDFYFNPRKFCRKYKLEDLVEYVKKLSE